MKQEVEKLKQWLDELENLSLPSYEELPSIPLYMDQVVSYVNDNLSSLGKETLTPFMVNNYVKADIIKEPINKKYNRDQIGHLLAITALKTTLNMGEISLLIEMDCKENETKDTLYSFFRQKFEELSHQIGLDVGEKMAKLADEYENANEDKKSEIKKELYQKIASLSLELAIKSGIYERIAKALIAGIGLDALGEDSGEMVFQEPANNKKEKKEAKRLASYKEKRKEQNKKNNKKEK